MTTKEILVALRTLLAEEKNWTKHAMARDANNYGIDPRSSRAERWCLVGGLAKITEDTLGRHEPYIRARDAIKAQASNMPIAHINDMATHAQVLALIDGAIAAA